MSAPLGAFVPKPAVTGDMFQASAVIGRPLIVQVVGVDEAVPVAARDGKPATVKGAITVHVWDLVGGFIGKDPTTQAPIQGAPNTVYCNVRWMAVALVDQLKGYLGAAPMPMKVVSQKNKSNEYSSLAPVAIEGPELQQVQAFFAQDPTRIEREAAAKAQAAATQAATPAYQQSGFSPMQVQPSQQLAPTQGFQQTAAQYGQQMQAPAAAQFQSAPGQPGAISQAPAQVAQQYAPMGQAFTQAAAPEVAQMPNPVEQAFQQMQPPAVQAYPGQFQQPSAAPNGMTPGAMVNAGQMTPAQAVQAYQQQAPAQPQFQQPGPPSMAPGPLGHVQNSDVANILAGLAANGQQPG